MNRELRYEKNATWTAEQQRALSKKTVAVFGCGGLGGYVIEHLGRMGVGQIIVCDGDVFTPSNLNRQLLATEENMGQNKAAEAKKRMQQVNSTVRVTAVEAFLTPEELRGLLEGVDCVMDCTDHAQARRMLCQAAQARGVPLVHGAVSGWSGQVGAFRTDFGLMDWLYSTSEPEAGETGSPSFVPAVIAGVQAAEAVKLLLGCPLAEQGRLILVDTLHHEYRIIEEEKHGHHQSGLHQ